MNASIKTQYLQLAKTAKFVAYDDRFGLESLTVELADGRLFEVVNRKRIPHAYRIPAAPNNASSLRVLCHLGDSLCPDLDEDDDQFDAPYAWVNYVLLCMNILYSDDYEGLQVQVAHALYANDAVEESPEERFLLQFANRWNSGFCSIEWVRDNKFCASNIVGEGLVYELCRNEHGKIDAELVEAAEVI